MEPYLYHRKIKNISEFKMITQNVIELEKPEKELKPALALYEI